MLLKCRYLSQFSVNELSKNASSICKAVDQCPFMTHVKRTVTTGTTNGTTLVQEQHQASPTPPPPPTETVKVARKTKRVPPPVQVLHELCTDSINCPFFKTSLADGSMSAAAMRRVIRKSPLVDTTNSVSSCEQDLNQQGAEEQLFNYDQFFQQQIDKKKRDGSYRQFKKVVRDASSFPQVQEHRPDGSLNPITIWCSNDYLGLGRHPYVQSRVCEAVNKYGAGSGGTRNISGSTPLHVQLEQELARLHQQDSALVFTSCYVANDTTLFTLAKMLKSPGYDQCHILSDEGNHASMIQGIRNSGMPKHIFRHNDCQHLESLLKKLPRGAPKIVAFESVHSMDGSICELKRMCDIAHEYGALAYCDEVHAVGLYGENGGGIGERDQCLEHIDIVTGTLGKAFGNIGGYIAANRSLVDTIRSYGSGFIFTTSLPPSVCAGSLAALEISRSDEGRELRARHQMYAALVKHKLSQAGLPIMAAPSHIVPVMVGDPAKAQEICNRLLDEYNIYIQAINYPTVARGTERLRIVPNPHHSIQNIEELCDALVNVWLQVGLELKQTSSTAGFNLHRG